MSDSIQAGLLFLIGTLFDLYLFVLIIRIILVWVGANYFDPVTQLVIKLTDFVVKPLRKILPTKAGVEFASIVLLLLLECIKFYLISILSFGMPHMAGLLILAFGDIIKLTIQTFFYAILLQALLSWVQPGNGINQFLNRFTSPIMRPIQRIVPPVGGMDISPIPALILLQFLSIIIANPLMRMGMGASFG